MANMGRIINDKFRAALLNQFRDSGMDQSRYAAKIGVSQSYLSNLLAGKRTGEKKIIEICERAGISLSYIINDISPGPRAPAPGNTPPAMAPDALEALITAAAAVLASNTPYAQALAEDIRAAHAGLLHYENTISAAMQRIEVLEAKCDRLMEQLDKPRNPTETKTAGAK